MDIEAEMIRRIEAALPGAEVELNDLTGTRDHWQAVIVHDDFAGKSRLKRQRLIFAALGELMHGPIHALTMQTMTPDEAQKEQ